MFSERARNEIGQELLRAERARLEGNEGLARVCARRAAGAAIREYNHARGLAVLQLSAYDLLSALKDEPALSNPARRAVEMLILRVDEEFHLPEGIDLLVEAKRLIDELEGLSDPGPAPRPSEADILQ